MIRMHLGHLARSLGLERRSGDAEFQGVSIDSRSLVAGELFVAIRGERFDGHDFLRQVAARGAAGAVVSRWQDIDLPQLVCPDTEIALGQIGAAWRGTCDARLVGVTGSNGKTTVKTMLHSVLQRGGPCLVNLGNLNNELGVPLTLCRLGPEHRTGVIEMGCGQPGDIRYLANLARPAVGIVNNAGMAHIERLGSVEGVARTKGELFEALPKDGVMIVNADDHFADYWLSLAEGRRVLRFGLEAEAEVCGRYEDVDGCAVLHLAGLAGEATIRLPVAGRHNALNALAAAAAAHALDATLDDIVAGLEQFEPVAGRLEINQLGDWTLIEDTYNANPDSLRAGIEALVARGGRPWLILGDMKELGEREVALHEEAGAAARRLGVERCFTIGELAAHAVRGFGEGGEHFAGAAPLVERFHELLEPGVVCLIKGSRGMRMETVARDLKDTAARGGATCS